MTRLTKRLSALLIALAMMLTGLSAVAEAPAVQIELPQAPVMAVMERGNAIQTVMDVKLDSQTAMGLLTMMGVTSPDDTSMQPVITAVIDAVNKLKTTTVSDMNNASISIGTESGELLNLHTVVDAQTGEISYATSLLPQLKISLPAEMTTAITDYQAQMQNMQAAAALFTPYAQTITQYFQENIGKDKTETGTFEVADVGTYTTRIVFDLTSYHSAGLVEKLAEVFKADEAARKFMDDNLTLMASQAAQPDSNTTYEGPKDSAELIAGLEQAVAELKGKEDQLLAYQTIYINDETNAVYTQTEVPPTAGDGSVNMLVTVDAKPSAAGSDTKIIMLVNPQTPPSIVMEEQPAETAEATETAETAEAPAAVEPEPTDWNALKAGILDGSNPSAMMVQANIANAKEEAANQEKSNVQVTLNMGGMNFGLTFDNTNTLTGDYKANGNMALSVMTPTPLLTVSVDTNEVAEKPSLVTSPEDKVVVLANEIKPEDEKLLGEALQKGLPQLMENLNKALPEEGPLLSAMLQGMMQQQAPATPN